ncbi:MAG: (d)CMP kinase [Firmicutes bacterium]|nr:(d)CMP kinase [Bacillota bacterium]
MEKLAIAIDGPAGAGKSTISKLVANRINLNYIDTGAMYRAITYKVINNGIEFDDKVEIIKLLNSTSIDFNHNHIYLDGKNVDKEIRENKISKNVSYIAKIKEVREKMVEIQRKIASNKSVIMDGRDIGTHVLPKADFKFYINASVEERGRRRYEELKEKNFDTTLKKIIEEIKNRDRIDSTREISPLRKSEDAFEIDTTNLTIDQVVDKIIKTIEKRRE